MGSRFGRNSVVRGLVARRLAVVAALGLLAACEPTVRLEAPREPITINLNIKLDADVRLRVEEKARDDVKSKPIF